jgi:hypothetical protein
LVVGLGSNNILGTVINFEIKWTGDDYADLERKRNYNAFAPRTFAANLTIYWSR